MSDARNEEMTFAWRFTRTPLSDDPPFYSSQMLKRHGPPKIHLLAPPAWERIIAALPSAPGHFLHRVRLGGEIIQDGTLLVASEQTILWSTNAREILLACARRWALDVLHLWNAPIVVREFLETGREELRVIAKAAAHAARAAAKAAEYAALIADPTDDYDPNFAASDAANAAAEAAEAAAAAGFATGSLNDTNTSEALAAIRAQQNDYITELVMKAHEEAENV